ncbi:MAG TPA: hypothetical protein VJZ27_03435 [Aggregatilineales bacterium]|nr:hypothetical protein [Aggregatilineales bacterium]
MRERPAPLMIGAIIIAVMICIAAGSAYVFFSLDDYALEFHQRVRGGYENLIAAEPERWVKINAAQSVQAVHAEVRRIIDERIKQP